MDHDFTPHSSAFEDASGSYTPPPRKSRARLVVAASVIAFLVGVGGTAYVVRYVKLPAPLQHVLGVSGAANAEGSTVADAAVAAPAPAGDPLRPSPNAAWEAVAEVSRVAEQQGGIDQRIAALEQRLTALDLRAQAAVGNAARAEGLLIAFAARRAIERGAPLGYLEDQLRLRFGDARPNSVQTVIDAAEKPVTLEQLMARLHTLSGNLIQAPKNEGFVARISREMSELFVIRRESDPSPAATLRLERARLFLETGRVDAAVAEVRRLPNAPAAALWIADAERYGSVMRALELLETTAILEPRELRDARGQAVEQPSPVGPADAAGPASAADGSSATATF